jgi:Zn-dependent protease with chaperone function
MRVLLYLPLLVTVLAAFGARPLADRLPPATATWLLTGSALVLAAITGAVLGLLAMTALLRVPLIADLGDMSPRIITRDDPASLPVAVVAGCALAVAAIAAMRTLWRRGRAITVAHRHARALPGTGRVVVSESNALDAYTLPGVPCRVVVTTGMLHALSPAQRRVLLAHERAHATWHHYLFTTATRLAATVNPLLRPVAAEVGYTVERWADERAAALTGDRKVAAGAVARAALATSAPSGRARSRRFGALAMVGPISLPGTRFLRGGARPGPVPRRVSALLRPAPASWQGHALTALVLLLVAVAGASALAAAVSLHALVELAQSPPA